MGGPVGAERLTASGDSLERREGGDGASGSKLVGVPPEEPVSSAVLVLNPAPPEGPTRFCSEEGC